MLWNYWLAGEQVKVFLNYYSSAHLLFREADKNALAVLQTTPSRKCYSYEYRYRTILPGAILLKRNINMRP